MHPRHSYKWLHWGKETNLIKQHVERHILSSHKMENRSSSHHWHNNSQISGKCNPQFHACCKMFSAIATDCQEASLLEEWKFQCHKLQTWRKSLRRNFLKDLNWKVCNSHFLLNFSSRKQLFRHRQGFSTCQWQEYWRIVTIDCTKDLNKATEQRYTPKIQKKRQSLGTENWSIDVPRP